MIDKFIVYYEYYTIIPYQIMDSTQILTYYVHGTFCGACFGFLMNPSIEFYHININTRKRNLFFFGIWGGIYGCMMGISVCALLKFLLEK